MAPDIPVNAAVTAVATSRHVILFMMVLLCVSVNLFSNKKAPFGADLTIEYLGH